MYSDGLTEAMDAQVRSTDPGALPPSQEAPGLVPVMSWRRSSRMSTASTGATGSGTIPRWWSQGGCRPGN